MALFLRGNVWWFEIKTTKIRIVKSTGFKRNERAKAESVYAACRLGLGIKPQRSAMEAMLEAIYSTTQQVHAFPIDSLWPVYEDWFKGKAKRVAQKTLDDRRRTVDLFIMFARPRKILDVSEVSVAVARQFVKSLEGQANKTIRNKIQTLAHIWEACGQIQPGLHNPWRAACPDDDGSGRRRDYFNADERERVFAACKVVGKDWYGVSLAACYTGLRYSDVATLHWSMVDMEHGILRVTPRKTSRHGIVVVLPIAKPLLEFFSSIPSDRRDGFVFPAHAVRVDKKSKGGYEYRRVLDVAKVDGYHDFHSWRHTFRSMLAEAGVSDETARRMGGWSSLRMAAHYDHDPHLDEMRNAIDKL